MHSTFRLALLALLTLSPAVHAQVTFQTAANLNATITDDGYNGTLASMTCVNVVATGSATVRGLQVRVFATHTWVGDLVFKVVSPANTTTTLVSRPGVIESADDGTAVGGNNSNLNAAFPITFVDGASNSGESLGSGLANSGVVCRDDAKCSYDPNAGAATAGKLAQFSGQALAGTWKFCGGDGGTGDTGSIQQVALIFASGVMLADLPTTDFGTLPIGVGSTDKFVTLTNTGDASLTISGLTLAAAPFARTAAGTCGNSLPKTLAPAESCTLSYTFTPSAGGSAMQTFTFTTDGVGDSGFTLTGSGQLPDPIFKDSFE